MNISNLSQSRTFRVAVVIVGVALVALLSFSAGLTVGIRKAKFSYAFGENYERNFGTGVPMSGRQQGEDGMMDGGKRSMMPFADADSRDFRNGHGLVGEVISTADGSIIVEDVFGNENTVSVGDNVIVKNGRETASVSDIAIGNHVAIIGEPDEEIGKVSARFVRILPEPSVGDSVTSVVDDNNQSER
jgi:hypothetical protein